MRSRQRKIAFRKCLVYLAVCVSLSLSIPLSQQGIDRLVGSTDPRLYSVANEATKCPSSILLKYKRSEGSSFGVSADVSELDARYHGSFGWLSQEKEDRYLHEHFFRGLQKGTFVELGALDGLRFSNTYIYEHVFNWSGLLIEGETDNYYALERNRGQGTNAVTLHAAICSDSKILKLYGTGPEASTSPNSKNKNIRKKVSWAPCLRMDDALKRSGIDHIDFLSLDVEGAELATLDTMNFRRTPTFVILVEMRKVDEGTNPKIRRYLHHHGFCRFADGVGHSNEVWINPKFRKGDDLVGDSNEVRFEDTYSDTTVNTMPQWSKGASDATSKHVASVASATFDYSRQSILPPDNDENILKEWSHAQAPVFVIGSGHSGTSLLCSLLDRHPDICCIFESNVYVLNRHEQLSAPLKLANPYSTPGTLGSTSRSFAINSTFSHYCNARKSRQTRWAEKTPKHIHHVEDIWRDFPTARIIFTVRNGADDVCSFARRYNFGNKDNVGDLKGFERWVGDNLAAQPILRDDRVFQLRLEDMVHDPHATLSELFTHCFLQSDHAIIEGILARVTSSSAVAFAPQLARAQERTRPHEYRRGQQMQHEISTDILRESNWRGCLQDGNISTSLASHLFCQDNHGQVVSSLQDDVDRRAFRDLMARFGYEMPVIDCLREERMNDSNQQ